MSRPLLKSVLLAAVLLAMVLLVLVLTLLIVLALVQYLPGLDLMRLLPPRYQTGLVGRTLDDYPSPLTSELRL